LKRIIRRDEQLTTGRRGPNRRKPQTIDASFYYPWPGHPDQPHWKRGWPNQLQFTQYLKVRDWLDENGEYLQPDKYTVINAETPENVLIYLNYVLLNTVMSMLSEHIFKMTDTGLDDDARRASQTFTMTPVTNQPVAQGSQGHFPFIPSDILSFCSDETGAHRFVSVIGKGCEVKYPYSEKLLFSGGEQDIPAGTSVQVSKEEEEIALRAIDSLFTKVPTTQEEVEAFIAENQISVNNRYTGFQPWFVGAMFLQEYRDREFLFLQVLTAIIKKYSLGAKRNPDKKHNQDVGIPKWLIDLVKSYMDEPIETMKVEIDSIDQIDPIINKRVSQVWIPMQNDDPESDEYKKRMYLKKARLSWDDGSFGYMYLRARDANGLVGYPPAEHGQPTQSGGSASEGDYTDALEHFFTSAEITYSDSEEDDGDDESIAPSSGDSDSYADIEDLVTGRKTNRTVQPRPRQRVIDSDEDDDAVSPTPAPAPAPAPAPSDPSPVPVPPRIPQAPTPVLSGYALASRVSLLWQYLSSNRVFQPITQRDVQLANTLSQLSDAQLAQSYALSRNRNGEYTVRFDFLQSEPLFGWQLDNRMRAKQQRGLGRGLFIADSMGLGKTVSAFACILDVIKLNGNGTARDVKSKVNILILATKSTATQWENEVAKFTGLNMLSAVFVWPPNQNWMAKLAERVNNCHVNIHVVTLATFNSRYEAIQNNNSIELYWDAIVVDEAHELRNRNAGQQLLKQLVPSVYARGGLVLLLSGTPIVNGLENIAAYADLCRPDLAEIETIRDTRYLNLQKSADGNNEGRRRIMEDIGNFLVQHDKTSGNIQNKFPALFVYPTEGDVPNTGETEKLDFGLLDLDKTNEYLTWQDTRTDGGRQKKPEKVSEFTYMNKLSNKLTRGRKLAQTNESMRVIDKMKIACIDARMVPNYPEYNDQAVPENTTWTINDDLKLAILAQPSSTLNALVETALLMQKNEYAAPKQLPVLMPDLTDVDAQEMLILQGQTYSGMAENKYYTEGDDSNLTLITGPNPGAAWGKPLQRKVLVFCQYNAPLYVVADLLHQKCAPFIPNLEKPQVFTGSLSMTQRETIIKNFKNNENAWFLCISTLAGGTGLNITAASGIIFLDRWWTSAVHDQAIARACRIGQTRDVRVAYVIPRNTVSRFIFSVQHQMQNDTRNQYLQLTNVQEVNGEFKINTAGTEPVAIVKERLVKKLRAYYRLERLVDAAQGQDDDEAAYNEPGDAQAAPGSAADDEGRIYEGGDVVMEDDGVGPFNIQPSGNAGPFEEAGPSGLAFPPPAAASPPVAAAPQVEVIDLTGDSDEDAHQDKSRRFENNRRATFNVEEELEKLKL